MPQIGIRFEELAFNDKAYDAESSRYFNSFSDWLTPYSASDRPTELTQTNNQ